MGFADISATRELILSNLVFNITHKTHYKQRLSYYRSSIYTAEYYLRGFFRVRPLS
jgi:hypothetical protein